MPTTRQDFGLGQVPNTYIVNSFGNNPDITTLEDIWDGGGPYTGFPSAAGTPEAFEVVSDSADDDAAGIGARFIRFYYLDSNFRFKSSGSSKKIAPNSVVAAVNGLTPVVSTSGFRVWFAEVIDAGSSGVNVGNITIRWTTSTSVVFAVIPAGAGCTRMSAFSVPADAQNAMIYRYGGIMNSASDRARLTFKLSNKINGDFLYTRPFAVSSAKDFADECNPALLVPQNTDMIIRCLGVDTGPADVSAFMHLALKFF